MVCIDFNIIIVFLFVSRIHSVYSIFIGIANLLQKTEKKIYNYSCSLMLSINTQSGNKLYLEGN